LETATTAPIRPDDDDPPPQSAEDTPPSVTIWAIAGCALVLAYVAVLVLLRPTG
jgi:hypothetical protein